MLVQASQVLVAIVDATHCGCALPMDLAAVAIPPPIKAHAAIGMSSMPMVQVKKSLRYRAVIVRGPHSMGTIRSRWRQLFCVCV